MPFHSPEFLVLCVVAFLAYWAAPERTQHSILFLASLAFYYYAGVQDTVLLLAVVVGNHVLAGRVANSPNHRRWLSLAVSANLAILGWFKYRSLVLELLGGSPQPSFAIPLGISFYLFQLIAYQVDLARGLVQRERSAWRLLLYVVFFPHHQAGPIMRPAAFLPQFYGTKKVDPYSWSVGAHWILWGLAKKVAADGLAYGVDARFADYDMVRGAGMAWSLLLRYALQIYGDFSGYSDIAVGLALLFGYQLDRNFHQPYLATNPSELWQRWHITLSAWLRDYLYVPLGGNRRGTLRTYVNLFLTMALGGLWHGASVMFLGWGILHGLLLMFHRAFPRVFAVAPFGWALTFGCTVLAWVPFRSPTWTATQHLAGQMFGAGGLGESRDLAVCLALLFGILLSQWLEERYVGVPAGRALLERGWLLVPAPVRGTLLAVGVLLLVTFMRDKTAYIYFRF